MIYSPHKLSDKAHLQQLIKPFKDLYFIDVTNCIIPIIFINVDTLMLM